MKAHVSNGAWEIIRIDNKLSIGNKSSYKISTHAHSTAPVLIKLSSWYGLMTSWKTTHKMAPTLAASMHQYSLWKKPSIGSMVTENQTHFTTFTSDLFFPNCYEHTILFTSYWTQVRWKQIRGAGFDPNYTGFESQIGPCDTDKQNKTHKEESSVALQTVPVTLHLTVQLNSRPSTNCMAICKNNTFR